MPRQIDYLFTLLSPWAYLGFDPFHALVKTHGVAIRYRPVMLGEVFSETGGLPLARRHPARQAYRMMELQRWRERRGVPLNLRPKGFPCDISLADKLVLAILAKGKSPETYLRAAHRAIWVEDRQLDDAGELRALLASVGHAASLVEDAGSAQIAAQYDDNRAWALETGVFGAPSYVMDGEIFWGQDRIDLLARMLESGRSPFRADAVS